MKNFLLKRFNSKAKELNLIRQDLNDFKKGHCTTHAALRLIECIIHGFNNNKATLALILDVEEAFDKVWVTGFISKLITAGIPAHFTQLSHSYLNNRYFTAVHGNSESSRRPILAGVAQGSLVGPVSFNIYINDIPSIQNGYNVFISLYAVDTNVTIRSESMQLTTNMLYTAVKILEPWLAIGKLRLTLVNVPSHYFPNGGVTSALITPIKFFHTTINWTKQVKYLGVTLDSKFTYKYHISKSLCAANHRLRQFHYILNKSSAININLVLTIYKSLFRSILTYATPAW